MICTGCKKDKKQEEFKWLQSKKCYSVKCLVCSIKGKKAHKARGEDSKYRERV